MSARNVTYEDPAAQQKAYIIRPSLLNTASGMRKRKASNIESVYAQTGGGAIGGVGGQVVFLSNDGRSTQKASYIS